MKTKIEEYLDAIVSGLPITKEERTEVREELAFHLNEHINELLIKGCTVEEAVECAIESFGNERKLNKELKKTMLPYYKVIRFLWSAVFATALICLISYSATKYYTPHNDFSLDTGSVAAVVSMFAALAGLWELLFEAVRAEFKKKWLTNPWSFYLIPSLFIGFLMSFSLIKHPEQYQNGLWLDLFAVPIGSLAFLLGRELFTLLFVRSKNKIKEKRTF
ncbi:permease prefix domain 1-containing protein [Peribacillus kribbensis]|uniref:permease prefix domain 1-containing protein n=1 Tax=Peribacillus kribbensis TaxID=356658 RepID=UPI0004082583|nr:permease prefix domain 1-containing protein [Peribacillus kribbensis]